VIIPETALWVSGLAVGLFLLDRLLLLLEARGWIYYRRNKPGRGASSYHLLEWTSVIDPTQRQVMEERVKEERREDESGDPIGPDGEGEETGARAELRGEGK
jgi:hypothetical protein